MRLKDNGEYGIVELLLLVLIIAIGILFAIH